MSKSNLLNLSYNDKEILIVGVHHNEKGLTINEMRKITDYANTKRNVCYLLELDERLNKHQLRNVRKGDFTTKHLLPQLKRIYGNLYSSICLKGWDIRQTLLTQQVQNVLYHNPTSLTMGQILEKLINKIPNNKQIDSKKYDKKVYNYINSEYKQKYNTRDNFINGGMFDWIILEHINKQNYTKKWHQLTLIEIKGINKQIEGFIEHLMKIFMRLSDLRVLEKILEKNNKMNYIIFVGRNHFNNLQIHLKNLKII